MGTKEICILVVNDDHTCRNIVAFMLQHPINSEVYHLETAIEALNTIRERRDRLELVLTNVHRTDTNRFGVIHLIEKEFKLPIILMNPDDTKIVSNGKGSEATICFLKSLSVEDINNIWESALAREKGKFVAFKGAKSDKQEFMHQNQGTGDETRVYRKKKKKENQERSKENEGRRNNSTVDRKPRVVWTNDMHEKFEEAIGQLGHERAFPKKIVEVMNIPGLTRENVASHLQKYRMIQKKNPGRIVDSYYGMPSSHPSQIFNSSSRNYQNHHWRPSYTSLINSEASTSILKFRQSNPSFKFNGDRNKSILLSIENSHPSSNSDTSGSFLGLRLGNDGKSIEFGQTRVMSNDETAKEMEVSFVENFVNQNSVHYPLLGNDLPLLGTNGNENSRQYLSSQPILGTDWNKNSSQFPSGLQILGTDWNENSSQFPSGLPILDTGRNENSGQCPYGLPLPMTSRNSHSDQSSFQSNNSIPDQQSSLCANVSSSQYPLTSINCVPQEETFLPPLPPLLHEFDSFAPEGDLDGLLNTAGSTSAQALSDGDFNDTLFYHAD